MVPVLSYASSCLTFEGQPLVHSWHNLEAGPQCPVACLERDAALHAVAVAPALHTLLGGALHGDLDTGGPHARELHADLGATLQGQLLVLEC